MKVAFWNGIGSSDDAINYVAAIGVMLAKEYQCKVVLGSNYISNHMLQDCFSGKIKEEGIAHTPYQFFCGSPEYRSTLWNMKRNRPGDVLEIPMEGVTIVYPPDEDKKRLFYYKIPCTTFYLLDLAEESSSVIPGGLEEADLVIVFLPQDVAKIQKFFHRFSSIIPKAIFVIEELHRKNRLFYRKTVAEYGINNKNIESIPKSKEHTEACEEGRLETFLSTVPSTKNMQYSFITGVKKVAKQLYEYASGQET